MFKKTTVVLLLVANIPVGGLAPTVGASSMQQTQYSSQPVQKRIHKVQSMPNIPQPYLMKDWKELTRTYDRFVFDFKKQGEYLPVGWWDQTHDNMNEETFGLMSYVGKFSQGGDGSQEAINMMAAVLGATLAGIDKSNQDGHNYVKMLQTFYNKDNGENMILNNTNTVSGQSFWYELLPHVLFYGLTSYYPEVDQMEEIMRTTADQWYDAAYELGGKYNRANFDYTAFNFNKMEPFINYKWTEPDAAAGVALLEYWAYAKFKDPKYLQAARWSMDFLQRQEENPMYEVLTYFAPYIAARMNAEAGGNYDVHKMINWIFDGGSIARDGWGVMTEKWGEYDVHGLMGSLTDNGGYAFAMNTFAAAGALAPVVRYDPRYAHDIGKWMLNTANNARLFYADGIPENLQSGAAWKGGPEHVVPYEGLRKTYKGKTPYASGDPTVYYWGNTDFSLYSGSYVGFLGGLIQETNVNGILRIDCLKTDYFHDSSYPTYLYYNPHESAKSVEVTGLGSTEVDLYDTVTGQIVAQSVTGSAMISIPADQAAVIALLPAGMQMTMKDHSIWVDGVYVAPEAKPVVNLLSLQQKQLVQGVLPLNIEALGPEEDGVKKVSLTFAGEEIYSGEVPPQNLTLDTTKYSNGFHDLEASVTTKNGLQDTAELQLFVRNEGRASILSVDAEQLAAWKPIGAMPGGSKEVNGKAVITENNPDGGYGGISSTSFKLDFNRKPLAVVDVDSVSSKWALQMHVQGESWGFYIKPDSPETGHFVIDVMKEMRNRHSDLPYIGEQDVELWLVAAGAEGAQATIERIDLFYQDETIVEPENWLGKHKAADLLNWTPVGSMTGSVVVDGDHAIIREENILNRGGISSPKLFVDLDKNPFVTLDVTDVTDEWSLLIYLEGTHEPYVIQPSVSKIGKQSYDVRQIIEEAHPGLEIGGVQKMQLWLVAEGDDKATVTIKDFELHYPSTMDWAKVITEAIIVVGAAAVIFGIILKKRRRAG